MQNNFGLATLTSPCAAEGLQEQASDFMHMHVNMSVSHENDLLEDHSKSGSCKSDVANEAQSLKCCQ